jgi:hypothetical protein
MLAWYNPLGAHIVKKMPQVRSDGNPMIKVIWPLIVNANYNLSQISQRETRKKRIHYF